MGFNIINGAEVQDSILVDESWVPPVVDEIKKEMSSFRVSQSLCDLKSAVSVC